MKLFQTILVLLWSLLNFGDHFSHGSSIPRRNTTVTVTIAVLGRSGPEISSTIRELIGPNFNCSQTNDGENLLEYTITNKPSRQNHYTLKLLNIPAFKDNQSGENDSAILATFKSYIQTEGPPDFYLVISNFDEIRFDSENSFFVEFLKKIEVFRNGFLNNIAHNHATQQNTLFLLTNLMSETKLNQRKPNVKIYEFSRIIQTFTTFPIPVNIIVGDNAAKEHGAKEEHGYFKLPNHQYYPKNVWQAFINSSTTTSTTNLLTWIMNNRRTEKNCHAAWISTELDNYQDDVDAFSYLLTLPNTTVEENKINSEIDTVFHENIITQKLKYIIQKVALQLRLQKNYIDEKEDLPGTLAELVSFFKRHQELTAKLPAYLLNKTFNITMPKFMESHDFSEQDKNLSDLIPSYLKMEAFQEIIPEFTPRKLTVGYGYNILADKFSSETPFRTDILEPSSVGYKFPNFMTCKNLLRPETHYYKSYSANMSDYFLERMKYLDFPEKINVTEENFVGKVKEGFNIQPDEDSKVVLLTTINEQRTLSCDLVLDQSKWVLNPEFTAEVESLVEFDRHDMDIVNQWNNWFSKWGSHIVTQGYGGGALHGSIAGGLASTSFLNIHSDEILNSIVKFTREPSLFWLQLPSYRQYGGESDLNIKDLYFLEGRNLIIQQWKDSLETYFRMLPTQLQLQPISTVVKAKLGLEKGEMVDNAIQLLLNGNLKYTKRVVTTTVKPPEDVAFEENISEIQRQQMEAELIHQRILKQMRKGKSPEECTGWMGYNPFCQVSRVND